MLDLKRRFTTSKQQKNSMIATPHYMVTAADIQNTINDI